MLLWYSNTVIENAMNFSRQVSRMLDEEHRSNLDLLGRVEQALGGAPRHDPALAGLLGQFERSLEHDIERHFVFEERALFPRLSEAGDGEMAALLADEHQAMRELALELLPLVRASTRLDAADWDALRQLALEIIERQVVHIQKETMALLPLLEDLLDEDTDRKLAFAYAEL